MEETRSEK